MTLAAQVQKMMSGEMYDDLTPELNEARERAFGIATAYNGAYGADPNRRRGILTELLGRVGERVHFEPTFRCEFGFNISIGSDFYANFDCVLLDGGGIEIGDNVLFGPRVGIYTTNHAIDPSERAAGGCYAKPVKIGDKVWLGAGVHVTQGVTIGDGSVIGAGSVVTKDVPAGVVAAGVPCRILREISPLDRSDFLSTALC